MQAGTRINDPFATLRAHHEARNASQEHTMTEPVNADMLAEALREASGTVFMDVIFRAERSSKHPMYPAWQEWQGILDRYDVQRREGIKKQVAVESEDRQSSMWRARFWRERQRHKDKARNVAIARAANHRILTLRRQLRELERHTNGTH